MRFAYCYPYLQDALGRLREYSLYWWVVHLLWVRYCTSPAYDFCGIVCNSFQLCFAQFLTLHPPTGVSLPVPKLNYLSGLFELIRCSGRFSFLEKIKNPFITTNQTFFFGRDMRQCFTRGKLACLICSQQKIRDVPRSSPRHWIYSMWNFSSRYEWGLVWFWSEGPTMLWNPIVSMLDFFLSRAASE